MSTTQKSPRDEFRERIRKIGVRNTEIEDEYPKKLYVYAPLGGVGIPSECYEDVNARLVESCGMDKLDDSHRLFRPYANHILIFVID